MNAPADLILPLDNEAKAVAAQSQHELEACLSASRKTQRIQIFDARRVAHQIELPTSALRLLVNILAELAEGHTVGIVSIHAELTTQEAADLLNVSRPHLIKLLENGALPHHKTGKHRRIKYVDLIDYKAKREAISESALEELSRQAQEFEMGYE